jgi:hypothetical protein
MERHHEIMVNQLVELCSILTKEEIEDPDWKPTFRELTKGLSPDVLDHLKEQLRKHNLMILEGEDADLENLKELALEAANALWAVGKGKSTDRPIIEINHNIYKLLRKMGFPKNRCPRCGTKMSLSITDYEDLTGHWSCPTLGCKE